MNEKEAQSEIVRVARKMLDGNIDLLSGCRIITGFQADMQDGQEDVLMPFCAVDSETDHFPLGVARDLCDSEYLKRVDNEIKHYLDLEAEYIKTACRNVIEKFSTPE